MLPPGSSPAGLAFLPTWLGDTTDAPPLDTVLSGWVRASGWRAAGLAWPVDADRGPTAVIAARPDGTDRAAPPPAEVSEIGAALRAGETETIVWQVPGSAGRLYSLLRPPGRPNGLVWAERGPDQPWAEADRDYLRLSARLIERSPALAAVTGRTLDAAELDRRLADAALIAGRMAHDFDNILTGIIGFADLSLPLIPAGTQPAKFVGEINKVGHRGIVFTQQLHQLSRSGQAKPLPGSVAQAVAKEEARLRPTLPVGTLVAAVAAELPPVAIDAGPLGVAIGHLMDNAVEASPPNGRVTVTARLVELSAADAKGYLGRVGPGPHVEVAVEDGGPGIKPEVRGRLFADPFYTTKVRHRGLGLAIVYRTLYAHRGGVRLDPAGPAGGTVARAVFPPAAARPAAPPAFATTTTTGG